MIDINEILKSRQKTHGDFLDNSDITLALWNIIISGKNFNNNKFSNVHKLGIFMILLKLSRAVSGDPMSVDSFKDIAGFAELIVKHIGFIGERS